MLNDVKFARRKKINVTSLHILIVVRYLYTGTYIHIWVESLKLNQRTSMILLQVQNVIWKTIWYRARIIVIKINHWSLFQAYMVLICTVFYYRHIWNLAECGVLGIARNAGCNKHGVVARFDLKHQYTFESLGPEPWCPLGIAATHICHVLMP